MTMGTASTMTSSAEALGLTLPGAASIPAADANHPRMAEMSGRRIVDMVWEDLKPSDIPHARIFRQRDHGRTCAVRLDQRGHPSHGDGGARGHRSSRSTASTRSRARRRCSRTCGRRAKYLMEDFYYAGGLRALLAELGERLHGECLTVNGKTLGENIADAKIYNTDVIRTRDKPLS